MYRRHLFVSPFQISLIPVPDSVPGQMTRAIAVGLSSWVQYEFRVAAMNSVGVGEPSAPSEAVLTKAAGTNLNPKSILISSTPHTKHSFFPLPVPFFFILYLSIFSPVAHLNLFIFFTSSSPYLLSTPFLSHFLLLLMFQAPSENAV